MMQLLIERLAKESFYEIIIVLFMVHRNEHFMSSLGSSLITRMLMNELNAGNKDEIIKYLIAHFE